MLGHGMRIAAAGGGAGSVVWRYIRFYVTANNGDQYLSIQEVEIATTPGGVDITSPTMVCNQDGYYSGSGYQNTFSKAFDNNLTDYANAVYVSDGTALPHWGYIDLAKGYQIKEVRIWPQNYAVGPARAPKDFKVQGSNDLLSWSDIKAFSGVTGWVIGTSKTFALA